MSQPHGDAGAARLAEEWAGRIVVRKIDVDQFEGIWERFNFRGIPAMIMFKDGQEIHRAIGLRGKRSWWPNSSRTSLDHGGRVSATRL